METFVVLCAAMLLTQTAVLATTIYLHRTLAHRSLALHPIADFTFRTILWITTGMRRREWVAVHRKHHTFTDREGDPHSPKMHGFWNVQLFNVYYYAREARKTETLEKYAPDLREDRLDRLMFSRGWVGLGIGIGALCLTLGLWPGLIAAGVHMTLYVFVVSPLINGLSHARGHQNFPNTAYNWRILSWFTGGESLHNNHHAHPRAPRFSVARWEFDPSWPVIKAMVALRVAVVLGTVVRL